MTSRTPPNDLDGQGIAAANGTMPAANPGTHAESPMTDVQAVELRDLAEKTGEEFDSSLSEDQAAQRIAYLREKV